MLESSAILWMTLGTLAAERRSLSLQSLILGEWTAGTMYLRSKDGLVAVRLAPGHWPLEEFFARGDRGTMEPTLGHLLAQALEQVRPAEKLPVFLHDSRTLPVTEWP